MAVLKAGLSVVMKVALMVVSWVDLKVVQME
jgi:hypothetical protein